MDENLIKSIIETYGYFGVASLICIENVFPPIPSEVILLFAGFMTLSTSLSPALVVVSATIGAVLGAVILYALGRIFKKERLKKLFATKFFSQVLRLKPEHVDQADVWFSKYEYKAVLICRCVPVLRSLISIPAGIAEMKILPFLLLTIIGSTVWNIILVTLGIIMGDAWEVCMPYFKQYEHIVIVVLAIACVAFVIWWFKKNRKKA